MTQTPLFCGWCGKEFNGPMTAKIHEGNCEVMLEEQQKEIERDERHRMESQLWEEEHAAGRI